MPYKASFCDFVYFLLSNLYTFDGKKLVYLYNMFL